MYFGIETFIGIIIYFIVATIFSIFSPLGIGFIIFSIIRIKTEGESLRKVSFIAQIILSILTFLGGLLISLIFTFGNRNYNYGSSFYLPSLEQLLPGVCVFFGVSFIVILQVVIIFWESSWLNNNTNTRKLVYRR